MSSGFKTYKYVGEHPGIEYKLMTDSEAATIGQRLRLSSGRLTCAASTLPTEAISLATVASATAASTLVPIIRPRRDIEFVGYGSTAVCIAATDIGSVLDCTTDGLYVTTTSSGGNFVVSNVDGTTALNNKCYGYFIDKEA
jgi:hypothetical protein